MIFLQRLSELIQSHGITKNKLFTTLGINRNSFVDWEKHNTLPNGEVISKIADYFDVSTDYLLGRTDEKIPSTAEAAPGDVLRSTLLLNYNQLNQEGQELLVDQSDTMVSSGKYIKNDPNKLGKAKNE